MGVERNGIQIRDLADDVVGMDLQRIIVDVALDRDLSRVA